MRHPFLRTLAGSGVTTDPNFENVTLLLHGDGTNGGQNNTFVDGSTNNFTITRNGNTTQGTFSPYGDNWSNYFDTTNTSLVATGTTSTGNFPTSTDFTIEFWWRSKLVNSGTGIVVAKTQFASTSADSWWMEVNGSYKVAFVGHSGTSTFTPVTSTTSVMDGVWHHCAVSRAGTTYRVFVDGALEQTTTNSTTMNQGSRNVTFAGITTVGGLNYAATGYISNLRIVVGTCLYTTSFTPSTTPLTSVTNTVLLTCQSNRFKDNGPNNYTISRQQGTPSVQRFSPFSPTAAYAAGTIGGSGYFDGTDDYLAVADNSNLRPGAGAFTIEAWIYRNASGAAHTIYAKGGASTGIVFQVTSGNVLRFTHTTTNIDSTGTIVGSSWNHVAIVREGTGTNQTKLYINGVQDGQGTVSTDFTQTEEVRVGTNRGATEDLNGYLSDVRFVKGTAVYTATFTPPSSPLSAITDTQFLCVFRNAAILDNAMMAVPETVGNAQISTSVKKYGTGSLYFDGTGDYIHCKYPAADVSAFGAGDFTVEFWLYTNAANTTYNVIDWRPTSTNGAYLAFYLDAGTPQVYFSSANKITGGAKIAGTTWTHVAICRSGSSMRLFIDGTQSGSTLTDTTSFLGSVDRPAVGGFGGFTNNPLNGYIDDLRVTKGFARYTANFTAPTAAFPDL